MAEAPADLLYMEDEGLPITYVQDEQGHLFVPDDPLLNIRVEGTVTMADAEFASEQQPQEKKYSLLSMALSNSVDLPPSIVKEIEDPTLNTIEEQTDPSPVLSADPYNDPPDPSFPFSFRVFNSLQEVQSIIQRMQDSAGVKFNVCKKGENFGLEENWDISKIDTEKIRSNFRVMFYWSTFERAMSRFSLPCVPFNGVPFMSVSHLAMGCEHLSLREPLTLKCEQVKEYRRQVDAGEIPHPDDAQEASTSVAASSPAKKRKVSLILPPGVQRFRETKKSGCNAVLTVKQIAYFPDYAIPPTMQANHKINQKISKELRWKLQKRPYEESEITYEMRYYMRIPNSWAHSGHEIRVQHPKYISQSFRERVINYLMTLKEREILSDIKFNVQGQKRHMKLHSAVLACGGVKIRDLLIRQDYSALADMLAPLNKSSLDAFFRFLYSGHLEMTPEVDVTALEAVFKDAGIKEGAEQCADHKTDPKAIALNDWTPTVRSSPVKRSLQPAKSIKPTSLTQMRASSLLQTMSTLFNFEDSEDWCNTIEQVIKDEETDSHAIMKKVILDRLASHFSVENPTDDVRCRADKATSTADIPQPQRHNVSPRSPIKVKSVIPEVSFRAVKVYTMKRGEANKMTADPIKIKADDVKDSVKNVQHNL